MSHDEPRPEPEPESELTSAQREAHAASAKKIPVVEVFGPTIQGEGATCGQRTVFIRFGLCDYRCTMCDSLHAVEPKLVKANARWLTQRDIADEVGALLAKTNCASVTYSGGNPCIHDLSDLTSNLQARGIKISLETQGTLCPSWVDVCDYITISPKGPGMGEKFEADKFTAFLRRAYFYSYRGPHTRVCVKIVVFSAADLEFASSVLEIVARETLLVAQKAFYLSIGNDVLPDSQAELEAMTPREIPEDLIDDHRNYLLKRLESVMEDLKGFPALRHARVLPQVHVMLWGNKRGV